MKAEIGIEDQDGKVHLREGAVTKWEELTNPETKKAYGWNVSIIFNDWAAPAVKGPDNITHLPAK